MIKKEYVYRGGIYAAGAILLAFGIHLSTCMTLGSSCIVSVPFSIAQAFDVNFSRMFFLTYVIMTAIQIFIKRDWRDILQLPICAAFSVLTAWMGRFQIHAKHLTGEVVILVGAVLFVGMGVSLMVNMHLIPNPADGLADTLGQLFGRDLGFGKNVLDTVCVVIAVVIDLLFSGQLVSVGIGTVISMVFIGRTAHLVNRLLGPAMLRAAGLSAPDANFSLEYET
jgi:uncharacterized membrane protein YczE